MSRLTLATTIVSPNVESNGPLEISRPSGASVCGLVVGSLEISRPSSVSRFIGGPLAVDNSESPSLFAVASGRDCFFRHGRRQRTAARRASCFEKSPPDDFLCFASGRRRRRARRFIVGHNRGARWCLRCANDRRPSSTPAECRLRLEAAQFVCHQDRL